MSSQAELRAVYLQVVLKNVDETQLQELWLQLQQNTVVKSPSVFLKGVEYFDPKRHKLYDQYDNSSSSHYKDGKVRSKCENKGIVPTEMELVLEYTQQGASHEVSEHLKMEMEIPCSNKIKFITACSFSNDSFEDIMKAQVSVIKASATLNIQAFKIKKSVSISFRMTQVHKMAKDHMMMIRDYDWMMISKKLKDHIQVKLKPKSLKFTASDSQDTNQ
ncbi:hypothetical protein Tco_0874763 [Tanacetum coccineum]|uniref:Uncharacterized protein n=1 Tax=Tanacetum coccineum TaxID=301880 RepID=A0ABQ5BQD1_9ASTR